MLPNIYKLLIYSGFFLLQLLINLKVLLSNMLNMKLFTSTTHS
jgi:hypothetical protein